MLRQHACTHLVTHSFLQNHDHLTSFLLMVERSQEQGEAVFECGTHLNSFCVLLAEPSKRFIYGLGVTTYATESECLKLAGDIVFCLQKMHTKNHRNDKLDSLML